MAQLRFGIGNGPRPGSRYWSLKTSARAPEFYLRGSKSGAFFGVSIHDDPNHWHWKVRRPNEPAQYHDFAPPPETAPGLVRAHTIVSHAVVASLGDQVPPAKAVKWFHPSSRNVRVEFDVFLEAPGIDPASWPGRTSMGTTFMGRVALSDGSTAVVVAREVPHTEQELTMRVADVDAAKKALHDALQTGQKWLLLMGFNPDGSAWLIDGPVDRASRRDRAVRWLRRRWRRMVRQRGAPT
jgi:hypothetical protein